MPSSPGAETHQKYQEYDGCVRELPVWSRGEGRAVGKATGEEGAEGAEASTEHPWG